MKTQSSRIITTFFYALVLITSLQTRADSSTPDAVSPWYKFNKPLTYYQSEEALSIADQVVLFQRATGGWGKSIDPSTPRSVIEQQTIKLKDRGIALAVDSPNYGKYSHQASTFDNHATWAHLRFLLRVYKLNPNERYLKAIESGFNFVFQAQNRQGGFPQNFPNIHGLGGLLTLNDKATTGTLWALKECHSETFSALSPKLRQACKNHFEKGIEFLVSTQIKHRGVLTGWAQQYTSDLLPAKGRVYEPIAIAAQETTEVIKLLMSIKQPSAEVVNAIKAAVTWLERTKIHNRKVIKTKSVKPVITTKMTIREYEGAEQKTIRVQNAGYDKQIIGAQGAVIWARFYSVDQNSPVFSDWDGGLYQDLSDISYERRIGYMWYGTWPKTLLRRDWPNWRRKYLPI